ncbi:Panacea domain-containing protein [Oribacterium sp. P6A1]|uniref:Panacea domain-containing protein n=1 Tax=Oribacterium sp. P6A1 TaxID=1410612 RepID=UPI00055E853E|nr:type II toxin-antitoxin system antitoxin SocA domain-containing protein [Oribacterium sp. P6A1]
MDKVMNIASYICEEYRKISGEAIDEMKLHKLLYLSQRESLAITGEPLFSEAFEGWKYGPVCVSVRIHFYDGIMNQGDAKDISDSAAYIVKNMILQYGELASWKLSQISHEEISWKNSRRGLDINQHGNVELNLEDIKIDSEKVRPYDSIYDMYLDEFEDYEETK